MTQSFEFESSSSSSRRLLQRDYAERLLERAVHLEKTDRLLIEQVYRHGMSITDAACMSGEEPRKVQRRIAKLLKRMDSDKFVFVLGHWELLPQSIHKTVELVVLQGHSFRRAARLSRLSLYQVRQHLRTLESLESLGAAVLTKQSVKIHTSKKSSLV